MSDRSGVLVAGAGAICSIGNTIAEIFQGLCEGRSGRAELRGFDRTRFRSRYAYEIDDRPAPGVDVPLRATGWLLRVVGDAARDAGLDDDLGAVPVLVGTTLRELRSVELNACEGVAFDPRELDFGAALRRRFGVTTSYTVANACAASLYALGMGCDLIESGESDVVVVAGVDTFTISTYGLLDRCYPQAPDVVRPFDRGRRGMVQGEGAAAVVLRRGGVDRPPGHHDRPPGHHARPPGHHHARVRGVAMNCDAYHPSAPDAKSVAAAIREAHRRGGVAPEDIDLVLLHGTGTPLNDEAEAAAVKDVFNLVNQSPLMTAIKSMIGHTGGASGLHSLLVAIEAMRTGLVPPVTTLDDPIDAVAGFRIAGKEAVPAELRISQVNSFGFGGLNAVAVLEKVA